MGVARKLEDIHQSLTLPAEQGKVMGFLTNTENAQRINGLVEDIREALMDYQVCVLNYSFSTMSDICARLHCNKISTTRVVSSL
jgi:hypothetical protein